MIMRYLKRIAIITLILSTVFIGSCKKQAKCGCDGDALGTGFESVPVYITYSEEDNWAEFSVEGSLYSRYYFCNPTSMMSELTKYDNGERVLMTCQLFWECNYMMQSSNSYYGSIYKAYMCEVVKIESAIYGNN